LSEYKITTNQIAAIFEIGQLWGGKLRSMTGVKGYKQRLRRVRTITIDHQRSRVTWSIWPNGNALITHIDEKDEHGQYTGWKEVNQKEFQAEIKRYEDANEQLLKGR